MAVHSDQIGKVTVGLFRVRGNEGGESLVLYGYRRKEGVIHLIALTVNAGADGGDDGHGIGAKGNHFGYRFGSDTCYRTAPPRVDGGDDLMLGITKKDRYTIGGLGREKETFSIGYKAVAIEFTSQIGLGDDFHPRGMDLRGDKRAIGCGTEGCSKATSIFGHIVGSCLGAKIQGVKTVFTTDAADTGGEAVGYP